MIVKDIMTTRLVTVKADDTLSHAANLLRQYQFHHLPVVHSVKKPGTPASEYFERNMLHLLEGLLTSQDIDLAAALAKQASSSASLRQPWQEKRVREVMHSATMRVTPTTNVAAAAQMLVERGLNCLPVVEYENLGDETQTVLVGLITRSDLLIALARSMGAFEPGMQITIALPLGDLTPLAKTLLLAKELHVQVRSVMAAPMEGSVPQDATLRLGTINPSPLLVRLQEANIAYTYADPLMEGHPHA
jgi:acetoin utilization protein AcuB